MEGLGMSSSWLDRPFFVTGSASLVVGAGRRSGWLRWREGGPPGARLGATISKRSDQRDPSPVLECRQGQAHHGSETAVCTG